MDMCSVEDALARLGLPNEGGVWSELAIMSTPAWGGDVLLTDLTVAFPENDPPGEIQAFWETLLCRPANTLWPGTEDEPISPWAVRYVTGFIHTTADHFTRVGVFAFDQASAAAVTCWEGAVTATQEIPPLLLGLVPTGPAMWRAVARVLLAQRLVALRELVNVAPLGCRIALAGTYARCLLRHEQEGRDSPCANAEAAALVELPTAIWTLIAHDDAGPAPIGSLVERLLQ